MDVLIILLIAYIFYGIVTAANRSTKQGPPALKLKQCPPHTWKWHDQPEMDCQYLKCTTCEMLPGLTTRDTP